MWEYTQQQNKSETKSILSEWPINCFELVLNLTRDKLRTWSTTKYWIHVLFTDKNGQLKFFCQEGKFVDKQIL